VASALSTDAGDGALPGGMAVSDRVPMDRPASEGNAGVHRISYSDLEQRVEALEEALPFAEIRAQDAQERVEVLEQLLEQHQ